MNWTKFQTYGDAPTKAFEVLCNQLFENWCRQEYETMISSFNVVNGAGGDGGVESYAVLKTGDIVGLQAKWFPFSIEAGQIAQVKNSIRTAMKIRPQIVRYIVCVPRDLASATGRTKGENAESNRWETMKSDMIEEFPKLTIELWNETRILTELQKPSSAGIYKFWFERSEISNESIKQAFLRSKSGWLSNLYVPDLNTFGEIDKYISKSLGTKLQRVKLKRTFSRVNSLCEKFLESLGELLSICKEHDPELEPMLMKVGEQLLKMNAETKQALLWFDNESYDIALDKSAFWIDLRDIIGRLKDSCAAHAYHFHFSGASNILIKLAQIDMGSMLSDFVAGNSQERLIFLGEPGTGKTHGFAAETERLLDEGYHIPILIRARDVPSYYGWKDIVIACLGLSNIWSDDEIWQALSALANRQKIHALDTIEQVSIFPKVIIMVDGVDESLPHQKWIERIREAGAIVQTYPQIRFCFSSRPYVFHGNTDVSAKYIRIGNSGDVPVSMLFESYINAYEIKIGISNSNGYLFYNAKKEIKGEYCITGEKWGTYQQYLFLNQEELLTKVEASGNSIVWIMREYRREDGKAREKFGNFYAEKDCCHIGFIKDGQFKAVQILRKCNNSRE